MKIKVVSSILICAMLLSCVATTAINADKAIPFSDVDPNAWYYKAVEYVYNNNYFEGTGDTTFAPSKEMSRSMFVTVLGSIAGINKDDYPYEDCFIDVEEGKWYVPYIMWAKATGIASGYNYLFGVNTPITREQMACMLYAFAKYQNIPVSGAKIVEFEKFGDCDSAHQWAKEAIAWMSTYELISGTSVEKGAPILSPLTTATRAQAAQIIYKYCTTNFDDSVKIAKLTLNGNNISEYKIVYGTTDTYHPGSNTAFTAAEKLQEIILEMTGVNLETYKDTDLTKTDKEILIGKTNREDDGTVSLDRAVLAEEEYVISMQGDYLMIAGSEKSEATLFAVYDFASIALGDTDFGYDYDYNPIKLQTSAKEIDIPDGYELTDKPTMKCRSFLSVNGGKDCMKSGQDLFVNLVHTLREFSEPDYNATYQFHLKYYLEADPCLTNEDNIAQIINSVKLLLKKSYRTNGQETWIWLTETDTGSFCECDSCQKVYKTWGRCATYFQIANFVAEAIKDEYPNAYLITLPYWQTHGHLIVTPTDADYAEFLSTYPNKTYIPKQSLTAYDNEIICYAMDVVCSSHPLGSNNCKNGSHNSSLATKEFETFHEICPRMFIWDYVDSVPEYSGPYYSLPWPNIYQIYENFNFFGKYDVQGMYEQGPGRDYTDFGNLRTYLESILSWNSKMTLEEFQYHLDQYLKAYYGSGWTYIREYIDQLEKLSNENEFHCWTRYDWRYIITPEQYTENLDSLAALTNKAFELADNETTKSHTCSLALQMKFIKLAMIYDEYAVAKKNSDPKADELLKEYEPLSLDFYNFAVEYTGKAPKGWYLDGNPYFWEF